MSAKITNININLYAKWWLLQPQWLGKENDKMINKYQHSKHSLDLLGWVCQVETVHLLLQEQHFHADSLHYHSAKEGAGRRLLTREKKGKYHLDIDYKYTL